MLKVTDINLQDNLPWDALVEESKTATFFQLKDWLSLWVKHFYPELFSFKLRQDKKNPEIRLRLFGIWENQKLVGIVPLMLKDKIISFLGAESVLGGEFVSDFGDIIAKPSYEEIVWKMVIDKLMKEKAQRDFLGIVLNFVREDSPSFAILKKLGGKEQLVDVAPCLKLPNTWENYLSSLSRHNRHELRRKIRKLEKEGGFKICFSDVSLINELFRLMALSDKEKQKFLSVKMKSFFQDIFSVFSLQKKLSLCLLNLNGKNIAAAVIFKYKDEILLYNSGFDPHFKYLSPGLILKAFIIKQAIESGKTKFDFLRGRERYKYDLGGEERRLFKISL